MPDEPQLVIASYEELFKFTGLRRTQIKELMAEGSFPQPVRLSARRAAWFARDIAQWQAARIAEQAEHERQERERAEREATGRQNLSMYDRIEEFVQDDELKTILHALAEKVGLEP